MRLRPLLGLLLLLLLPVAGAGELVVVVRQDSEIGQLRRDDVINIFLGRYRQLPSGKLAEPLDLTPESGTFYEHLTGKSRAEINAYWARLLFTGRTTPPRQIDSQEKLIDTLLKNPQAIGYIDSTRLDRRLRVIFEPER